MEITFSGQVAIVTGAGTGLGRSHALELARRGAKLVINDFAGPDQPITAAEDLAQEITDAGGNAFAYRANVADFEACAAMVAAAQHRWGRVDVLINNAGILRDKSFGKMEMADWRAVVDVHLNGSANCARAVWPLMKDQGYGRILMTTSSSGIYGNFGQANYGAAKMGLIGLMNTLCIEGAKSDICVNCLSPTAATAMTEGVLSDDLMTKLAPEAATAAAVFLVSQGAPNRQVIFAGAGSYAAMEIRESQGVTLAKDDQTAEQVAQSFRGVSDMAGAAVLTTGPEHVAKITAPINPQSGDTP